MKRRKKLCEKEDFEKEKKMKKKKRLERRRNLETSRIRMEALNGERERRNKR